MNDLNKVWMSNAKNIGCTFAAMFAKKPELVGWKTIVNPDKLVIPEGCFILSLQFPKYKSFQEVLCWAMDNGFYMEGLGKKNVGIRYRLGENIAWVQYFGHDSHVVTRKAPVPELMMCVKLPAKYYFKVGFKGILHLAHASIQHLKESKVHKLWETSFAQTEKSIGHKPTLKEASKTTFNLDHF